MYVAKNHANRRTYMVLPYSENPHMNRKVLKLFWGVGESKWVDSSPTFPSSDTSRGVAASCLDFVSNNQFREKNK